MLGRLRSIQSEKGFALLTMAMVIGILGVLGAAITIATIQVFRGASFNQATLAPASGQLTQAGEAIGTAQVQTQSDIFPVPTSWLNYSIVSTAGDVTVQGNAQIISDPGSPVAGGVYAAGNVVVQNNAVVASKVVATGTITTLNQGTINGTQMTMPTPGVIFFTEAEIIELVNRYKAEAGAPQPVGDYTINGNQTLGPIYIQGDLNIAGNANITITGTVYLTGKVKITGTPSFRFSGAKALVAEGDIAVKGNGRLPPDQIPLVISANGNISDSGSTEIVAILYAARGNVSISGNSAVYGAVIGRSVTFGGSSLTFPAAFAPQQ